MARDLSPKSVAIWLGLFLLLALALRIGGNVGPSYDDETGRYLYSGNDPYYHDRVVNHITETGESMVFDEAINFPQGDLNPNPPLYDWTTSLVAGIFDTAGVGDSVGLALNVMVAIWGALTVIPVYMMGRDLFGKRAGLWAAFLMAVSAPHIQRGVFGFADHDATTMFFIALAIMFLIKALKALDDREYVKDWRHPAALMEGIRNSFGHNHRAYAFSALAGIALSATALTWKGYPYALAVMAVAVGVQLLWDHVKNKDSTAMFGIYLLPLLLVTLVPLPYYMVFADFMDTTIMAGLYVLVGVLVVGAVLVPTRDLPSILVFPALALAMGLGLIFMLLVRPDIGATIFTGLGYFEQTKLYTTIAEAQRSELGRVAASFGFFTFLLGFWGFARSVKKGWAGKPEHILMASWAAVALFMAFAASRFIMNAAPVFAILAGAVIVTLVEKIGFEAVRKRFRQQHGQNSAAAGMRSMTGRTTMGAIMLALFIVLPNLWLGVDASLPCEVDNCQDPDTKRFGAFGIDFDIKENGWLETLAYLSTLDVEQDGQPLAIEDKPGFIAWWDYGHWATDIGHHPAVADPFQNHYNLAGRFIASESEEEAMSWLTILLLNYDYANGGYEPGVRNALLAYDSGNGTSLTEIGPMRGYDKEMEVFSAKVQGDDVFDLFEAVQEEGGKEIGYFAVDRRMYPFSSNSPGIFYAPAFLANKNPDDFIQFRWSGSTIDLRVEQYGVDENGDSYRLEFPRTVDSAGNEYYVYQNQAYRVDQPVGAAGGIPVQDGVVPTQAFFNSMYARGFGHAQNGFSAGDSLAHWRVAYQAQDNNFPSVSLLEYYHGVSVSGRVTDDANQPLAGVQVTFVDGYGARHDVATTFGDGTFTVLAPFSVQGDLNLTVMSGNAMLYTTDAYQFTREQAEGSELNNVNVVVNRGGVEGRAYRDVDGNNQFNASIDQPIVATVSLNGEEITSGADGLYVFNNVMPGQASVSFTAAGYDDRTTAVTVLPGETATANGVMTPLSSDVTLTLTGSESLVGVPVTITSQDTEIPMPRTADENEQIAVPMQPGTYSFVVDYTITQGSEQVHYAADSTFTVSFGGDAQSFNQAVSVTRSPL